MLFCLKLYTYIFLYKICFYSSYDLAQANRYLVKLTINNGSGNYHQSIILVDKKQKKVLLTFLLFLIDLDDENV